MGTRTTCAVIVAASLLAHEAWADLQVTLVKPHVAIRVPDDWTVEELAFENGISIYRPGEQYVGSISFRDDVTCDATQVSIQTDWGSANEGSPALAEWRGGIFTRGETTDAYYCRDVTLPDGAYQAYFRAQPDDVITIAGIADDAIARANAPIETPPVEPPALELHVRAGWTVERALGKDRVVDAAGETVAEVAVVEGYCRYLLDLEISSATNPALASVDVPGWDGRRGDQADGRTRWVFCRDLDVYGQQVKGVVVGVARLEDAHELVLAAWDAAVRKHGEPQVEKPPSLLSRFLPNRYEVGFSRLTNGNEGTLFVPEGWGATLAVEKTLYDAGLPAWGYRARLTPTGAGTAGYLEGGIGAGFKGIAIQAVAGFGAAGSRAPFSVQAGVHAGLTIRFIEIEGGYRWTGGGTDFQFEGRFGIPGEHNTYTMGIGYERREESSLFTIDVGIVRLPDLD